MLDEEATPPPPKILGIKINKMVHQFERAYKRDVVARLVDASVFDKPRDDVVRAVKMAEDGSLTEQDLIWSENFNYAATAVTQKLEKA